MDNLVIAREFSAETIRKERGKHTLKSGYRLPSGEMRKFDIEMTGEGGLEIAVAQMIPAGGWGAKAAGEMDWNRADILKFGDGMTLSFQKGVDDEPLLYEKIYRTMPGAAFQSEIVPIQDLLGLKAAFTIISGGESVPLAEWKYGEDSVARFYTFGTGYQLTRDDVRWNKYYKAAQASYEIGQAYNRALNNLHFAPIFAYNYTGTKITAAVVNSNCSAFERVWLTLFQASQDIPAQKDAVFGTSIKPRIGICNRKTAGIYNAVNNTGLWVRGSKYEPINLFDELIIYEGYTGVVNGTTYTYSGPADGEIYAVEPKGKFVSVLKEPNTALSQMGDILKLEDMKFANEFVVLHAEDVANGVHKIVLPAIDVSTLMFPVTIANASLPIEVTNKVGTPVPSSAAGAVADNTKVTLTSATPDVAFFYTVDGSAPTLASTQYVHATGVVITDACTLKAIAVKSGLMDSDILSVAYTIS